MKNEVVCVALVAFLCAFGCEKKNSPAEASESSNGSAKAVQVEPGFPPVAEETAAVFRIDRDALADVLSDTLGPDAPQVRPFEMFLPMLVNGRVPQQTLFQKSDEHALDGLGDAPVFMGLSMAPSAAAVDRLQAGVPIWKGEELPTAFAVRLMTRASDHGAVEKSLNAWCEKAGGCPHRGDLEKTTNGWTYLDVWVTAPGKPSPEKIAVDTDYFERDTRAKRAFFGEETAVAVYTKTRDIARLPLLIGGTDVRFALSTVKDPTLGLARGLGVIQTQASFGNGELFEVEDTAVTFRAVDDGGYEMRATQTFTELGVAYAKLAVDAAKLPSHTVEDAEVHAAFQLLPAAALKNVESPGWMVSGAESLAEKTKTAGVWGYAIPMLAYPVGYQKGAIEAYSGKEGLLGEWAELMRAAEAVGVSYSRQGGADIAVAIPKDAELQTAAVRERLRRVLGQKVEEETRSGEDGGWLLISADSDGKKFGDPEDVTNELRIQGRMLGAMSQGTPVEAVVSRVAGSSGVLVRLRGDTRGRVVQAMIGVSEPADIDLAGMDIPAMRVDEVPACRDEVRAINTRHLWRFGRGEASSEDARKAALEALEALDCDIEAVSESIDAWNSLGR